MNRSSLRYPMRLHTQVRTQSTTSPHAAHQRVNSGVVVIFIVVAGRVGISVTPDFACTAQSFPA